MRYEFFARHMESGDVLMLAHHGQDQVETVLMRIFQGRGCCLCEGMGRWAGSFYSAVSVQHKSRLVDYLRVCCWVDDQVTATMLDVIFTYPSITPGSSAVANYAHGVQRSVDDLSASGRC